MQSGIFLIASGGDYEYEIMRVSDGKALLRITLNRTHGLHEYVVLPDQERDVIKFYQWYPFNVPEEKRVVVSELMTFLTWGKAMAAYQMDVGDGSIGWRSTIFVRDADFASERPTQVFVALMHATDDNWRAILTVSCDLALILCQGSGSLIYRLTEGKPLTWEFIRRVFDLSSALPPQSTLLFAQFFSSFEEVAFRGVFLTMLLATLPPRRAILYSAIAFGALHLPAVLAGHALVNTLGQVVWAFLFGLFYGYLFIKSGSLLPPMIIHWFSNVFQAPLTAYWHSAPPAVNALYGIVFGYGLATLLLLLWVRFFCARWLSERSPAASVP